MSADLLISLLFAVPYTLALTVVSLAIGLVLGAPICAARVSRIAVLRLAVGSLILLIRAVPPLVWLFLIFFGLGTGFIKLNAFWAASIGLGLLTAANMAEIYRGSLAAIHHGQWEASNALGLPRWNLMSEIIGPQLIRISLPAVATYAIALLKETAIASTIGVPELAYQAHHISQQTFRGLEVFGPAAVFYIALSLPIAWISRKVDAKIRARVAR
jgi:polar amino acid transport system permease protein